MKPKRNNAKKNLKNLKKNLYLGRATKFKRTIIIMVLAGFTVSLLYLFRYIYIGYAASNANIILTYPEIALSQNPDGSRFASYEFVSEDNLREALERMQQERKYTDYTVSDLRDCFEVRSVLENSANALVASSRSAGNDFSYVANEYSLTYTQPHDYHNKNVFRKIFSSDYSRDFLDTLVEVNRERFADKTGGYSGFETLTEVDDTENYDYGEKLYVYRTKIRAISAFLNSLHEKYPDFVTTEGLSLKDIEGKYRFLVYDKLDGISNFIESSGISKDTDQASNKIKVSIENNTLKYNKHLDRSQINKFAMENYDHTFTENLINVIQNDRYGLYQARPKTAYDTVVEQKHHEDESIAEYSAVIKEFNRQLSIYTESEYPTEEDLSDNGPLIEKCERLIGDFETEYKSVSDTACKAVKEYYNRMNKSYLTAEITHSRLFTYNLLVKMAVVFVISAALAFIVAIFVNTISDSRKLKNKKMKIKEIKQSAGEMEM
ncbi:MAG: hypothetical protein J1F64_02805 [Oscillospiraceae bacterium]|nr:hypothetical protein [Oscillospiraceae bacterium]